MDGCGWKWRLAAVCLLSLLWVANAQAYLVRGTPKCSEWGADAEEKSWVMGYISGRNAALDESWTKGQDMAVIYAFIAEFCRAQRDKDADDALQAYAKGEPVKSVATPAGGPYQNLSWLDLRLDAASLMGKKIQTRARLSAFGGMVILSDPDKRFDGNGLMAEQEELSRDDRAFILQSCSSGCVVNVQGQVVEVMMQPGLLLHRLLR